MKTMEQNNVDTVHQFIETFWNQNELDVVDRFLSDDYQEFSYHSKDGLKNSQERSWKHFPIKATR